MDLPFLVSKKKKAGASGPVQSRESDQTNTETLKHMILEELLDAVSKKDIKSMRDALKALVTMIRDADKET
jgi:hypothetical protein